MHHYLMIFVILIILFLKLISSTENFTLSQSPIDQNDGKMDEFNILMNKSHNSLMEKSIYAHDMLDIKYYDTESMDQKMVNNISKNFPLNLNPVKQEMWPLKAKEIALIPEQLAIDNISLYDTLRFIIGLHSMYLTVIVPGNAVLNNFNDLSGKKCALINSTGNIYIEKIFQILNIQMDYTVFNNYNEIIDAWENEAIDTVVLFCPHTNPFIKAFSLQFKIKFLDLDTSTFSDYQQKMLQFNYITLKNTSYSLIDYRSSSIQQSVKTIGMRMVLCTHENSPSGHIYKLIDTIFNNFLQIKKEYEGLQLSDLYYTQFIFQYHSGAKEIYTDKGYITELESPYCKHFIGKSKCTQESIDMAKILEERTTNQVM